MSITVSRTGFFHQQQVLEEQLEPHTLEELLFQFSFRDLDLNGLVNLLGVSALVVGVVLDSSREKGVDESGLAESRLACHHNSKGSSTLRNDLVPVKRISLWIWIAAFVESERTVGSAATRESAFIAMKDISRGLTLAMPMGDAASAIVMFWIED